MTEESKHRSDALKFILSNLSPSTSVGIEWLTLQFWALHPPWIWRRMQGKSLTWWDHRAASTKTWIQAGPTWGQHWDKAEDLLATSGGW